MNAKNNGRALTNREKSTMRRDALNAIAFALASQNGGVLLTKRGNPVKTWRELETALMRKATEGEEFLLRFRPEL